MNPAAAGTFRDLVLAHAGRSPDAPFLLAPEPGVTLTYADLANAAAALDRTLGEWGVRPGEIVAFMLENGVAAATLFVGTMAAGRVVAPINLLAQDAHLDYVLGHAAPRVVFAGEAYLPRLERAAARSGVACRFVRTGADALELPFRDPGPLAPLDPGAAAMLMYTSGTTGVPKGVPLSHANMLHAGRAVAAHQRMRADDRVLSSLPLYHINGQCIAVASSLCAGASVVMPHRFSTSQWWPLVARCRPTWLNLVPTIVAYLLNGPDPDAAERDACRRVRFARSASAPLAPEQQRAFESRFGIPIVEAMGLTECASVAFCNPMPPARGRVGSVGRPLGAEARVVAPDGRVLPANERGEIEVRGPNVMAGYYRSPEQTAAAIGPDGWLRTGDLGHRDDDGFYFVTGRLKELIIKGGENIAPREIDEALLAHPAVLECAAVGVPDAMYGQEILACVVVKPGHALAEDEIRAHCEAALGRYKTPRHWRFVDDLPKGPSGKVQRMKLAEGFRP